MRNIDTQKGFTLVELAIVMTIIGLLIGGILKGQELMQNARITATISQVRGYEAAVTTFRDKYDGLPGDLANAATRIPNCTALCTPAAAGATAAPGDNIVGRTDWASNGTPWVTQTANPPGGTAAPANAADSISYETNLFWAHLLLSDLISGVTNASIASTSSTAAWAASHPASKLTSGAGFVVGYGSGAITPGETTTIAPNGGPNGLILVLMSSPTTSGVAAMTGSGVQPLSPARAMQIDQKMDDSLPTSGYVQAYGLATSCFFDSSGAGTGPYVYKGSVPTNDCGLMFRIQG